MLTHSWKHSGNTVPFTRLVSIVWKSQLTVIEPPTAEEGPTTTWPHPHPQNCLSGGLSRTLPVLMPAIMDAYSIR